MSTSATVYARRSISWDTVKLASGATFAAGVIFPDAVLEERLDDDSVISENPVEIGTVNNDNQFDTPQEVEILCTWSPASQQANGQAGFLDSIYQKVLALKQAKINLFVVTGKRQYQNMRIKGISNITDKDSENVLTLRITFRQMLFALTETVSIPPAAQQAQPQKTAPVSNSGSVPLLPGSNYNTGG
ncbi:MAG: phage baseplate protein [Acidobacteriota bacterium]